MKAGHAVPLAAFVVLALLLGVGLKLNPREVPSPFIGKAAPAFSLPQLADGRSQSDDQPDVAALDVDRNDVAQTGNQGA